MGGIWERREDFKGRWLAILLFVIVLTGCGGSISDPFFGKRCPEDGIADDSDAC